MLKELFNQQRGIPRSDTLRSQEHIEQSVKTFDALVDFLRDSQRFPNTDINELITLAWRLIGRRHTPTAIDQSGILKVLRFLVQLGAITSMASAGRDFYTGVLERDSADIVTLRANAFEADTLLTLRQMAEAEQVELTMNPYQTQLLQRFPNGLVDLPPHLNYPTPVYNPQNYRRN